MFNLIEPGHILRFGVDPYTIPSPHGSHGTNNDNTLETLWTGSSSLGSVQCISHPTGAVGKIATDVVKRLRGGGSIARSISYSGAGRLLTASARTVGAANCDFVGYTDGRSNYIATNQATFSKDFSGCLFVSYSVNGQRRVAHAAASDNAAMDCKQSFLDTLRKKNAVLHGWFRPYQIVTDGNLKATEYAIAQLYMNSKINNLTTFGVITATGEAYSINAFKPYGHGPDPVNGKMPGWGAVLPGNDWIVTSIFRKLMSQSWNVT